ncbi:MAG: hypothetical protein HY744_02215 [Deltaproteobacteria bacterium]|nr:hypothetical protein [Deltaproteobacteria bacterium]
MTPAPAPPSGPRAADLVAVALTSGAAIALQIALTRVLSIALWHHFAFLVVGLALLGFGLAGSWLFARGGAVRAGEERLADVLARRALLAALAALGSLLAALAIHPNALELFRSASTAFSLGLLALLATVPFFGAGIVIGTALAGWPERVGRIYAADLVGGGAAAALALAALPRLGALGTIAAAVLLLATAALLLARTRRARRASALAALVLCAAAAGLLRDEDDWLAPAPTKEIARFHSPALRAQWLERRAWTAHGRVDVTRPFAGPPLMAGEVGPGAGTWTIRMAFQDGAAPTTMHRIERDPAELSFLPRSTTAAAWVLRGARFGPREARPRRGSRALVIGVGGGVDVMMALAYGASEVTGVELNPALLDLLRGPYRAFTGNLAGRPEVRLVEAEGRAFVRRSRARYDVIQLAGADTFTALSSGAHSLAEAHLYTLEAFADYFAHLAPGGCLSVCRLFLDPPRETLRLAVTAEHAMRRRGVVEPWRRIAVLRGRQWATLLGCERDISPAEMERLRGLAAREGFSLPFDPLRAEPGPFRSALVGDASGRERFIASYPFRIAPATDEAPFFFDYFRWTRLPAFAGLRSESVYATAVPVGHGVQLLTLALATALAALGMVLPARRRTGAVLGRRWGGFYFAAIGAAFLLVEVALVQRLTFFLGQPTVALGAVLGSLLAAAGVGAALSRRAHGARGWLGLTLPPGLALAWAASTWALPALVGLGFAARLGLALALAVPLGVLMGMPFVAGIARLRGPWQPLVPWAFAANGLFTVLAAAAAPLLAAEIGFSVLFLLASAIYAAAFVALPRVGAPADAGAAPPASPNTVKPSR